MWASRRAPREPPFRLIGPSVVTRAPRCIDEACQHVEVPNGRFAPSPTGDLHLGNLRTAMVAWLMARCSSGRFVLRVDDLDPLTCKPELAARQRVDLEALGIDFDAPTVHQSQRLADYHAAIEELHKRGLVYECYCTRREIAEAASAPNGPLGDSSYPGTCRNLSPPQRAARRSEGRPPALRLDAARRTVSFDDRFCGRYEAVVDDVVLRRNDGMPAYNLAVVVDDATQGVEEVVRADDLVTSTPRQILLAELLGLRPVSYAHVPLVLGPDGKRLAKRDGAVTLADRVARGDDVDAVRSMLAASLGLCERGERVTMEALAHRFDPQLLPRVPWVIDPNEL